MKKIILILSVLVAGCVSSARYEALEQRLLEMERRNSPQKAETDDVPDKADARNPAASERRQQDMPQPVTVTTAIVPRGHGPYGAWLSNGACRGAAGFETKSIRNEFCNGERRGSCSFSNTWMSFQTTSNERFVIAGAEVDSHTGMSMLGPQQRMCFEIGREAPSLHIMYFRRTAAGFVPSSKEVTAFSTAPFEHYRFDESYP